MFQENVFCFTPKGSVIKLPKDATAIDFAYAVHTKIGDTAVGCEINGNKSELQSILRNGDRIKIITSKNHHHHFTGFQQQKLEKPELLSEDIGMIEVRKSRKE